MKMKRNSFDSMEAFEAYTNVYGSTEPNTVTIVREEGKNGKWMCVDLTTDCKRAKTSARRMFSVLTYEEVHHELNWRLEDVEELIDNGCFELHEDGEFSFGCEEIDEGVWYIYLNVRTEPSEEEVEEAVIEEVAEEIEQMKFDTKSDLQRQCDGIAEELKRVYEGEAVVDEDEAERYGIEEGDALTMWDYFTTDFEAYDIEYSIGGNGEYRGVRLLVACGGPNIYINTRSGEVEGYWWTDTAKAWIPSEVCESIDDVWREYFSMMIV